MSHINLNNVNFFISASRGGNSFRVKYTKLCPGQDVGAYGEEGVGLGEASEREEAGKEAGGHAGLSVRW